MAQYGSGDQLRREGRQTDEYGNPIHSATVGQFGDEVRRADEYGNQQIRKTDEFGNPIHSGGTMGGDYGSTGHQHGLGQTTGGLGTGAYGTTTGHGTGGATGGDFDYGSGGRSTGQTGYQGLGTEPGSYQNQPSATTMGGGAGGGFGTGTGAGTGRYEEKGVMEKIKEKLPGGGHGTEEQHRMGGGVYEESGHEKKGVMEKIKEKLPGGRH